MSKLSTTGRNTKALTIGYIKIQGRILMFTTDYRSSKETEHMLLSASWKFLIHSIKELEVLLVCNRLYCAEIVHAVSSKNHRTSWKEEPS